MRSAFTFLNLLSFPPLTSPVSSSASSCKHHGCLPSLSYKPGWLTSIPSFITAFCLLNPSDDTALASPYPCNAVSSPTSSSLYLLVLTVPSTLSVYALLVSHVQSYLPLLQVTVITYHEAHKSCHICTMLFDFSTCRLDTEALVKDLRETFRKGQTRTYTWRLDQLQSILNMLQEREAEIIQALRHDFGKQPYEMYAREVSLVSDSCMDALKHLKHWIAPQKVPTSIPLYPSSAAIVPEPLGVVLIISAWNFPFLLAMDPLVGAIAAGNAAVVKPSELAPALSAILSRLVPLYLDQSAIRVVEGRIVETTALLQQKWDKIFYTGSPKVGKTIMVDAAKHLTPVTLELSGKCPLIIDSTVDLKVAARHIVAGKWGMNNGQTCVAPDYVLTSDTVAPKLINAVRDTLEKFYGVDPSKSSDLSRIVNFGHFTRLTRILHDPRISDKIVHGGQWDEKHLYIAPTILLDTPLDSAIMTEEIFGPLLPIIGVDEMETAINIVNSMPKPLLLYLFTNDKDFQEKVAANISAGGMVINNIVSNSANSSLPIEAGESGLVMYHGKVSFDIFSHKKAVLYRSLAGDMLMRYPPYTKPKQSLIKYLLNRNIIGKVLLLLGWRKLEV